MTNLWSAQCRSDAIERDDLQMDVRTSFTLARQN